jgi:hypothetical protein
VERGEAAGALLAERHRHEVEAEPLGTTLNLAERPRAGQWTLRAALVRFAQPEPVRAGAVLDLVRRCEWALQPLIRPLEVHIVDADRDLSLGRVRRERSDAGAGWTIEPGGERYPDARLVDLARLVVDADDEAGIIVSSYRSRLELDLPEVEALPLLEPLVVLDRMGDALARWALEAPAAPPVALVDEACRQAHHQLEELGATGPTAEHRPDGPPSRPIRRRRAGRGGAS